MKYRIELDFFIEEDEEERPCTQEELQHIFDEELGGCCTSVSNIKLLGVVKGEDDLFERIENTEVTVPANYTADISEEEKKDSEFLDTLNTNY